MNDNAEKFYEFEDFRLDRFRDVLFRGDAIVDITPKAVQILKLLVERSGEAVSKEEICAKVWPDSRLGCPGPGLAPPPRLTRGFEIDLRAGGKRYTYHSDDASRIIPCPPQPAR